MKFIHDLVTRTILAIISFNALSAGTRSNIPVNHKEQREQKISFTENKGQVSDQNFKVRPDILFSGNANGMVYHLRNDGISYQLSRVDSWKEEKHPAFIFPKGMRVKKLPDQVTIFRLDINWLGINKNFTIQTEKPIEGFSNYFLAVCPNGVTGVQTYEGVYYADIYTNIKLHYYQKNNNLKYDYIVAPGGDYKQIRFEVKGCENISVQHDGSVIFVTPLGKLKEDAPLVFQNGKQIPAKWILKNNILSFDIRQFDPTQELVIDPAIRIWGTYYGGIEIEDGHGCATDASGNVYLAGFSESSTGTVIATSGSHQNVFGGGNCDAYLAKFNSAGIRQWATYYGDGADEIAYFCCTDAFGNVYMTGYCGSGTGTVIATTGSHQSTGGGNVDAFLVKFNSAGIRQWATYYGGQSWDYGTMCSTDAGGNVYITGWTSSGTSIATATSHQPVLSGGFDAYLAKFNSAGVRQWSTYYGGTGNEQGFSCTTDAGGNIFLSGWTESTTGTLIATSGAHQSVFGGGIVDAFLVKFNSAGVRQWGTYYGGSGGDLSYAGAIDLNGNVYVAGYTQSNTGTTIATASSHQPAFGGGVDDAFLVKFNTAGLRLWGTYYGGTSIDANWACTTDASGNVYTAGTTVSNNGAAIATTGSQQIAFGGGVDAFFVKFDGSGVRQWGTYYGGPGGEDAYSCSADANGNAYLAGNTTLITSTVIATAGSHQSAFGGNYSDAYLVKFCGPTAISVNSGAICSGNSFTIIPSGANTYTLQGGNYVVSPLVNTSYSVLGTNSEGCVTEVPAIANVTVSATPTVSVNSGSICKGNSFTIVPSGANTYTLQGGNTVVSPTVNTTYTVVGTNSVGCNSSIVTATVDVNSLPTLTVAGNNGVFCLGESVTLSVKGANSYTWSTASTATSIIVTPFGAGSFTYSVSGTGSNGCTDTTNIQININKCTAVKEAGMNYSELLIYPNPNEGEFILASDCETVITLENQLGQVIMIIKLSAVNNYKASVSELANGIYFVRGQNKNSRFIAKIVVNN